MTDNIGMSYSKDDLRQLHNYLGNQNRLPLAQDEFFLHSFECKGCHGFDPQAHAMVDNAGNDVNLYDDWQTSMMALAAIDPLWRAKVSHEGQVNPSHAEALENSCTKCHAPMGRYTAQYKGQLPYTIADLENDSLGLDGVSCSACHMIDSTVGNTFSGIVPFDTNHYGANGYRQEYGPFPSPVVGNMQLYVGITPTYSTHVSEGRMCSSCHTLITETVDLSGNPTGGHFVEQATYHEWQNSSYPSLSITCQICHMPQIEDAVVLMVGDLGLQPRSPFNLHYFNGANSYMVELIKNNKHRLGLDSIPDKNFDSTLATINRILTQNTVALSILGTPFASQDSLYIDIEIRNKAGHKFPSGYPSRRAFVQTIVTKLSGDTLFKSGLYDSQGEIINNTGPYQNHYTFINQESQTQIYEMVMGDVNGNKTTVLERAADQLKDNRIPPFGFLSTHPSYDTMKIAGNAVADPDFNKTGASEGSGKDLLSYHIPLNGYSGNVNVYTKVFYQTINPGWLSEMFSYSTPAIDTFRNMYLNSDMSPLLIARDSIMNVVLNVSVADNLDVHVKVYPNPSTDGRMMIQSGGIGITECKVFDLTGKEVIINSFRNARGDYELQLPPQRGTYILKINTSEGVLVKKLVRY